MKILLFAALVFSSLRLSGQYTGGNGKGEGLVVRNSTFLAVNLNAYQSGFGDAGYFGKVFKQEYGMTPQEWRGQQH